VGLLVDELFAGIQLFVRFWTTICLQEFECFLLIILDLRLLLIYDIESWTSVFIQLRRIGCCGKIDTFQG